MGLLYFIICTRLQFNKRVGRIFLIPVSFIERRTANNQENGFLRTGTVREPGEYAVRGGLVDLFAAGGDEPVRLDFFGETGREVTVVMCGDHGDCLGENGLWGHGFYHPKVMEVPMAIFNYPSGAVKREEARVLERPLQADLRPTVGDERRDVLTQERHRARLVIRHEMLVVFATGDEARHLDDARRLHVRQAP